MIKKLYILLSVIAFLFSWSADFALGYTYPTIVLDGQQLPIAVPAIDEYGRTMVPVRAFFEEMGAVVSWDQGKRTVMISKADTEIRLTIGQNTAYVNGKAVNLDIPPLILDGRIVVPLRFVAEAIGAEVTWNAEKNQIDIQTTPQPGIKESPTASPGSNHAPGFITTEPDNAMPTSPPSSKSKTFVLNPQIPYILIALLIVVGAVCGVLFLKHSRKRAASVQIAALDGVDLGEINQSAYNKDVVDWEEGDHQSQMRETVDRVEAEYAALNPEIGATADARHQEEIINAGNQDAAGQKPVPQDEDEAVEAYYNKGIKMIKQQNWTEARLALVYPSITKYRDSEELGYYIEAKEHYDESQNSSAADPHWAAVMADFYCRKIPDDYDGLFKEEIQELKTVCKSNLARFKEDL